MRHLQTTRADITFSVIQWIYSKSSSRPDIPHLPNLPIPPEATAVVHKKSIVNTIGYWKNVNETYSYPRVDFFRQAQFANLKFELVPSLTGLKFLWDEKNYHDVGPHPKYMERLKTEKDYAAKELAAMLIRAEREFFFVAYRAKVVVFLIQSHSHFVVEVQDRSCVAALLAQERYSDPHVEKESQACGYC